MSATNDTTFENFSSQTPYQTEVILSVSDFTYRLQRLLESAVPPLWIQGEISNFTVASSGHWYFQIKDEKSQLSCVMFRFKNTKLDWIPSNGMAVELRGTTSYYALGGKTQVTVEEMRQAGQGRLFEAFNALKNKLEREGLFDTERKKPIPTHPRCVGIVTSPIAAALQDVLTTFKRRGPQIHLIIYPTRVQGEGASAEIAKAIEAANQRLECDVLIVCRGGGSMEDLWAYNEENLARTIAQSQIPIISGVGHETDFTIADFVADRRAPTPTAAAELVSPDRPQQVRQLQLVGQRLQQFIRRLIEREMMRIDQLQHKISNTLQLWLKQQLILLSRFEQRLVHPGQRIRQQQSALSQIQIRLQLAQRRIFERAQVKLKNIEQSFHYLNPEQVLARGFAIVRQPSGAILKNSQETREEDNLHIQLSQGSLEVKVTSVQAPKDTD